MTPEEFLEWITPPSQSVCSRYGLPAACVIAQAAIESGWGRYSIGNFNLFGRKWGGLGPYLELWTKEQEPEDAYQQDETHIYNGDGWWDILAKFQNYQSLDEAIEDWCILITQEECYQPVLEHLDNLEDFVRTLAPIYATSKTYAEDLLSTIRANNLDKEEQYV